MGLFYCLQFAIDTNMSYPTVIDVYQAKAFLSRYADSTPPPTEGAPVGAPLPKPRVKRFSGRMSDLPPTVLSKLTAIKAQARRNYSGYSKEQIKTVMDSFSMYDLYMEIKNTPLWTNTTARGAMK